jgi:hypothetical protein
MDARKLQLLAQNGGQLVEADLRLQDVVAGLQALQQLLFLFVTCYLARGLLLHSVNQRDQNHDCHNP